MNIEPDDDDAVDVAPRPRRKGIYILPNLFTLAALFGGFYAVVMEIGRASCRERVCNGV